MDVRVGLERKLSAKELMLLNCGVGEDSFPLKPNPLSETPTDRYPYRFGRSGEGTPGQLPLPWWVSVQRTARRDKKAFLSDQCKETQENNRMGKTRDFFNKMRDTKGTFHATMGTIGRGDTRRAQ